MKGFLIVLLLVLSNCVSNSVIPSPESTVILSYKYYPVPEIFGDSIKVYVDNKFDHTFYAKDFKLDTFNVPIDKEVLAQYTVGGNVKTDNFKVLSDTVRILLGYGFGKVCR